MCRHCHRRCPCRAAAARPAARSATRPAPTAASLPGPRCPARAPCAPAPPSVRGAPLPVGSHSVRSCACSMHAHVYRRCMVMYLVRPLRRHQGPAWVGAQEASPRHRAWQTVAAALRVWPAAPRESAVHTAHARPACHQRACGNLVRHMPTIPTTQSQTRRRIQRTQNTERGDSAACSLHMLGARAHHPGPGRARGRVDGHGGRVRALRRQWRARRRAAWALIGSAPVRGPACRAGRPRAEASCVARQRSPRAGRRRLRNSRRPGRQRRRRAVGRGGCGRRRHRVREAAWPRLPRRRGLGGGAVAQDLARRRAGRGLQRAARGRGHAWQHHRPQRRPATHRRQPGRVTAPSANSCLLRCQRA